MNETAIVLQNAVPINYIPEGKLMFDTYNSIINALEKMVKKPGFVGKCEHGDPMEQVEVMVVFYLIYIMDKLSRPIFFECPKRLWSNVKF